MGNNRKRLIYNMAKKICLERDSKRENVIRDVFNKYKKSYNLKEK